jgi:hypothetical protein
MLQGSPELAFYTRIIKRVSFIIVQVCAKHPKLFGTFKIPDAMRIRDLTQQSQLKAASYDA